MSRSTGGERGNTYRYAYIIVYKLNQGRRRRKDVPFHRGRGGATYGRRRRKDVAFHRGEEGGNVYRYAFLIVYKLNHGGGGGGPAESQPYIGTIL